jgi:hypothetical protein
MDAQDFTVDKFKNPSISRNELDLFTTDMIGRIENKTNSVLPESEFTVLVTCHKNFKGSLGKVKVDSAFQVEGTISREDATDEILEYVRRKEGVINDIFPNKGVGYVAFYPAGLTEYNQATVEGMRDLMVRYLAAATKYKAEVGQKFVDDVNALIALYDNARKEQVKDITTNSTSGNTVRNNRKALTLHLSKCLHLIAADTIEKPDEFNSYFNFGLLEVDNDKDGVDNGDTPPEG